MVANMTARDGVVPKTAQELADDHDMRIVRAKQLCRKVIYKGLFQFIGGFCHHDGDAEMIVYLKGCAEPVRPCEITFQEQQT